MNPACTAGQLDFHGLGRRAVVGQFDEGTSSSDSGGLLLGEGAQRRYMLKRLVGGFVDHRDASQIEPSVELLIKQGVMGLAWGYEDRNDHDTRSAHTRGHLLTRGLNSSRSRNIVLFSIGGFHCADRQPTWIGEQHPLWAPRTSHPSREPVDINRLLPPEQHAQIAAAFAQTGFGNLTGATELLGDLCDYGQLRIFRALHGKKPHEYSFSKP